MAVTTAVYGLLGQNLNGINFTSDTFNLALTTDAYAYDLDADDFFNDVTNEITGTGYTAGGEALTSVTFTYNSTDVQMELSADEVSWTSATFTTRLGVLYKVGGTPSTSPLLALIDFGIDYSPVAETFKVTFNDGVAFALTAMTTT